MLLLAYNPSHQLYRFNKRVTNIGDIQVDSFEADSSSGVENKVLHESNRLQMETSEWSRKGRLWSALHIFDITNKLFFKWHVFLQFLIHNLNKEKLSLARNSQRSTKFDLEEMFLTLSCIQAKNLCVKLSS